MIIVTPHQHGAGYFANNVADNKLKQEGDVQQCAHCERVLIMQQWRDDGGFCSRCMAPVCVWCADRMLTYGCEPALKKIELAFECAEKYRQFCKLAGLEPSNGGEGR